MEAVRFENVTKIFKSGLMGKSVVALRDLSFQICEGENLAIMGPSPSGKTTLLKLTAGIYMPDKGEIKVYGKSVKKNLNDIRRYTYYISQQMQLNKKLTIWEEIAYFQRIFNEKMSEECIKLLEASGIGKEDYDNRIETISETQSTVLKLVLGLIKKPKILLIDNVLGGLEQKIMDEVSMMLSSIKELTIMVVDKNVDVLNRLCGKILLLRDGTLIGIGSLREILLDYPYKYDVEVKWRKIIREEELINFGYPYQCLGEMTRFYLKNKLEVKDLSNKLLENMENIISFQTSGIDMEDIYYWRINRGNEKNK
ncbi:MAG: ABC transporter ATP-binding protein [Candidatus Methanomethylicia archaeon]